MKRIKRKGREDKNTFRATKAWTEFRLQLLKDRGLYCECCKRKLPKHSLQIHHLVPEEYQNLNPINFAILCSSCHKEVEKISRRKDLSELRPEYINCYKPFLTGEHIF